MNQRPSIPKYFTNLTDPRRYNRRHKLIDIITIAICAVICNADGFEHIAEFGQAKYDWFKRFLELPHGIPSTDTFERVFALIDPKEFKICFMHWVKAISQLTKGEVIAVDGKTLRRSHDKSNGKAAIHMVSAWACANGIVLGQVKTEEKSNEITAIPELLKMLEIKGCIVTIDAMGCQKRICETIIEKEADYVLSLKGNHGHLHDDVQAYFQDFKQNEFKNAVFDYHETIDGEHGRIEIRKYWTSSDISWLQGKENWRNLETICMVERERQFVDRTENETSYYIGSLASNAEKYSNATRSHWGVENSLHWVLDVSFNEDGSRIRKGNAPDNFAVLRHIALNLIKKETSLKKSIKCKRLRAGWDDNYLSTILATG
ncbi:putative H repeat-associated protein [Desulfosarcina cetonica]|uniref:ISAs1 family transposase n=1 Tax=Desulfosarcina cetonica TaxID=90730 RepID=UPI0006CFE4B7|nr:ISAs1 family transposase [Desulfosarcina cetonica]VTR64807.1 putative H repeat-associated protein [Desulfosarcina cetonica]VTR65147.1 putative H repeat-associated protein [Desulfosarcina cetonica]VTR65236.1 putative H repeat-associated protein [Desulfosarcina cetonica]VTR65499.1 putative H repeat-associated protein [Desulfosarcina cetonica]VTR66186.1 putative H repeat-associated protein [Desulfosarcina cetonica]